MVLVVQQTAALCVFRCKSAKGTCRCRVFRQLVRQAFRLVVVADPFDTVPISLDYQIIDFIPELAR